MRFKFFVFFILPVLISLSTAFLSGVALAESDGQAQSADLSGIAPRGSEASAQAGTIGSVRTVGNRSIETDKILSCVRSRTGQVFDEKLASEDAKRIAGLEGVEYAYYSTEIVEGAVQLTFVVAERPVVRSIVFKGNKKVRAGTLRTKLGFKKGERLEVVVAEAGRTDLVELYRKKGFAFAEVRLDDEKLRSGEVVYTIEEGPRVKITAVRFKGNDSIKNGDLRKVIKTEARKFVFWPSYYTEEGIEKDVLKLQKVYYEKGFLDSRVRSLKKLSEDKKKIRITFVISEGMVYTVEGVDIEGNEHFSDQELFAQLKSSKGAVYSEKQSLSDVKQLLKVYREAGYIDVKAEHRVRYGEKGTVFVTFEVTEGHRFRIGRIMITGNDQTKDKTIRQVLEEYKFSPGNWYNADIARGDGTGYLEKLVGRTVMTEAPHSSYIKHSGTQPEQRDAQVSVTEGKSGMVMLGAGVASDSGVIGQLVFEQQNFDISDKPRSFGEFITGRAFKGAGQNLRVSLSPGTQVSEYMVSFSEPYFQNKPTTLELVGSSWERWRESYDEKRLKGFVGFEDRLEKSWRRSTGFRAENVEVVNLDSDAPQEVIDDKGNNFIGAVRFGVGKDLRDDRFNPTSGYMSDAGYEQAAGDHTFGILSGTYRRYETLAQDLAERKTVLAAKLHAATVLGDAPVFEKFYAGGSGFYGIRGFDYRGVSTRGLQTNVAMPERKDPIGSDWIFLANAEVTVPLAGDSLSWLLFVDSGAIDTGPYRIGAGVGIQILIPQWFGPVPMRFELAAPIKKDDNDDTQVFSFSVGRLF
jgi:outer membrane protein assembly complex protein YaeT